MPRANYNEDNEVICPFCKIIAHEHDEGIFCDNCFRIFYICQECETEDFSIFTAVVGNNVNYPSFLPCTSEEKAKLEITLEWDDDNDDTIIYYKPSTEKITYCHAPTGLSDFAYYIWECPNCHYEMITHAD